MNELNHMPNTAISFFENGETEYKYFSSESMDNFWSMDWFINYVDLAEFIALHDGTQIVCKHPSYEKYYQVDVGGLGDFYSHKFVVTLIDEI